MEKDNSNNKVIAFRNGCYEQICCPLANENNVFIVGNCIYLCSNQFNKGQIKVNKGEITYDAMPNCEYAVINRQTIITLTLENSSNLTKIFDCDFQNKLE
jgi:hypothetical protein